MDEKKKCRYPGCKTLLVQYNKGDYCYAHVEPAKDLEEYKRQLAEESRIAETRKNTADDSKKEYNRDSELLTVQDMVKELRHSDRTLRHWLKTGVIRGHRLAPRGKWIVVRSEIDRFRKPTAKQEVKDTIKEELVPHKKAYELTQQLISKAQDEHLVKIHDAIEEWANRFNTPQIDSVFPETANPTISIEANPLFKYLREHLAGQTFWENYSSWRDKLDEYLLSCNNLIEEIQGREEIGKYALSITIWYERPILTRISDSALAKTREPHRFRVQELERFPNPNRIGESAEENNTANEHNEMIEEDKTGNKQNEILIDRISEEEVVLEKAIKQIEDAFGSESVMMLNEPEEIWVMNLYVDDTCVAEVVERDRWAVQDIYKAISDYYIDSVK